MSAIITASNSLKKAIGADGMVIISHKVNQGSTVIVDWNDNPLCLIETLNELIVECKKKVVSEMAAQVKEIYSSVKTPHRRKVPAKKVTKK